ncbi:FmdB family zinc ribbon protein [Citricoccus sp. K5]|uniref:FmdB family zinc ribbon protein n=1 Tax=Citricoccus sp. K5 TaxID=2653135 RepID=UPI0012F465EB|nr:FmdB family zinc ribbon protein [Citricoccus sp. K5]VXB60588.1 Putative FmdB family regulatory protein [Citricoccus sp. K5]
MPTYAYACKDCGHEFDIVQSFTDDSLTACPECEGTLRKKFNSVGVVFKGSGFYRNDSRAEGSGSKASTTLAADSSSGSSSDSAASSGSSTSTDSGSSSSPSTSGAAAASSSGSGAASSSSSGSSSSGTAA